MKNNHFHNLNIELKKIDNLKYINFDSETEQFDFSCNFKEVIEIELIDECVLFIKFKNGELRLDISKSDLNKILKIL